MALDFASMLLKPSPATPWDLSPGGGGSAREQLQLMREKFDWEKKRAIEEDELERQAQAAKQAADQLAHQRAQEKAQAERDAATLAARRAAQSQFSEFVAKRDFEGAEAFIPQLEMLGGGVDITRSPSGFPTYRIHDDAKKDQQAEEQNRLLYREMASPEFDQPYTPPAPVTGHVLDTSAMQQQTLQRLSPYLSAQVESYPEGPYRDSAELTQQGVEALGLSAADSATRFRTDRQGVDAAVKDTLDAEEAAAPKELTEMDRSTLRGRGESRADDKFKALKVGDALAKRHDAQMLITMLDKPDPMFAQVLGPAIMSVAGVLGAQSNMDMLETLGLSRQTLIEQGTGWIEQKLLSGGFTEKQKNAFREWLNEAVDASTMQAFDFMDIARTRIRGGDESEDERTGWRNYLLTIPPDIREEYELYRHDAGDDEAEADVIGGGRGRSASSARFDPDQVEAASAATPDEIEEELMNQAAEAGLDFEQILPLMRTESGGDPTVRNHMGSSAAGLFQFTDKTAKAYGLKNAAEYAALPAAEQIALGIRRFKGLGLDETSTADDFAMANAAPGYVGRPDDTVIAEYKAGTKTGDDVRAKNPGWIPPGGGEITVGSIKAFYRRHRKGGADKADGAARTKEDQDALDLMR